MDWAAGRNRTALLQKEKKYPPSTAVLDTAQSHPHSLIGTARNDVIVKDSVPCCVQVTSSPQRPHSGGLPVMLSISLYPWSALAVWPQEQFVK